MTVAICCVAAFSLLRSPLFCLPLYYRTPSRHAVWNQRKLALLRSICRPRYSPGFRVGRLAWSINAGAPAPDHLPSTLLSYRFRSNRSTTINKGLPLLLMVLLRKARPRPSMTQGCLLQSTRRRRYSPSEPAPDHLGFSQTNPQPATKASLLRSTSVDPKLPRTFFKRPLQKGCFFTHNGRCFASCPGLLLRCPQLH